jgi:hypothetical protein
MSAGPAPAPGLEIVVGMPLGVDTPGRPPRIPPVPGKLINELPPDPGEDPRRELFAPGRPGTLESSVGACAATRSAHIEEASAKTRLAIRANLVAGLMALREPTRGRAGPIFRFNLGLEPTGRAPFQSVTSLDSPRP